MKKLLEKKILARNRHVVPIEKHEIHIKINVSLNKIHFTVIKQTKVLLILPRECTIQKVLGLNFDSVFISLTLLRQKQLIMAKCM